MKLRIHGNSLRLRLTTDEVIQLVSKGKIEDSVYFGPGENQRLIYALEVASDAGGDVAVRYAKGCIAIQLPEALALQWARTDLVGIDGEQKIDNGRTLKLLIEKDFARTSKRIGIDNADNKANLSEAIVC
jgi:hypothetical protein